MKTAVLACNTLRDELLLATSRVKSVHDTYWVESNQHNFPDKLKSTLQKHLDELDGYDQILLAFGFCGGSVGGLKTGSFSLVIPRIDDCISLLLGSIAERERLSEGENSIYLTQGWLDHESNIWTEYQYTLDKYGEEKAQYVIDAMYGHYQRLALIDTGAYEVAALFDRADQIADRFGLARKVIPGTVDYLEQLLTGPYDEQRFIVVPPHTELGLGELRLY